MEGGADAVVSNFIHNIITFFFSFYVGLERVVFFYFRNNSWRRHSQVSLELILTRKT